MSVDEAVGAITAAAREALETYAAERDAELADAAALVTQANADLAEQQQRYDSLNEDYQGLLQRYDYLQAEFDAYRASHPDVTEPAPLKIIGMSSPASVWSARLAEVGPQGVTARRIFADLADGPADQMNLVEQANADGMLPVLSYKVGGNIAGALAGQYDGAAQIAAARLAGYGVPVAVTFWHEPNPDITAAQFLALHRRYLPIFQVGSVKVGPILNGWLLDKNRATFESFLADDLLDAWDWVGMDSYQSGTLTNPGTIGPGDRMPALLQVLTDHGHPDKPVLIGEYNGYSADVIAAAGETWLSTPSLWVACCWNNDGGKGVKLAGDRLTAFQATKADPRAMQ